MAARRPLLVLLCCAAALAAGSEPAVAAPLVGADFASMNAQGVARAAPGSWDAQLAAIAATGVASVRSDAVWSDVEPVAPVAGVHVRDFTALDRWVAALAEHGLRWAPIVDYAAPWASSLPGSILAAPRAPADFAAYAGALATRYGPGGSFWAARPGLPALPVRTWEVWNEENLPFFWGAAPDPAAYADLYAATRAALRAVDPGASAVVGGLSSNGTSGFVSAMLAARPGLTVDAVAVHPYAADAAGVLASVVASRRELRGAGLGSVPLVVNELGWPTHGPAGWVPLADGVRAGVLADAVLALGRSDCGVAAVAPYTWLTAEGDPADAEQWYGLAHADASVSATATAYASAVASLRSASPPTATRPCAAAAAGGGGGSSAADATPAASPASAPGAATTASTMPSPIPTPSTSALPAGLRTPIADARVDAAHRTLRFTEMSPAAGVVRYTLRSTGAHPAVLAHGQRSLAAGRAAVRLRATRSLPARVALVARFRSASGGRLDADRTHCPPADQIGGRC